MASAAHTPGPWQANCRDTSPTMRGDDGIRYVEVVPAGEFRGTLATVHDARNIGGISLDERDANARLIAAAPDLLAAAKAAIDGAQDRVTGIDCFALNDLSAAIAKAEGR